MTRRRRRKKKPIEFLGDVSPPRELRTIHYRFNHRAKGTEFILKTPEDIVIHGLILDEDPIPTINKLWWLTVTPMCALFDFPFLENGV